MTFEGETVIRDFDDSFRRQPSALTAVLIVLRGEDIGRRYLLNEKSLIVGRDPKRAKIVVADPAVSGSHCRIDFVPQTGQYTITDLASRNGMLVNAAKAEYAPLKDGDRIFIGETILKFTFQDVVEEHYHSELHTLMNVDSLTGLPVKRILDSEFRKEFMKTERLPLAVVMADMDGLKKINDAHGHLHGAHCIAEVGRLVGEIMAGQGIASRFGGDEFIAFLPNCTIERAEEIAERIRSGVEQHTFERNGIRVQPTISIGIAERTPNVKTPEELIRLADDALYRAKRAGRNTVSR